MKKLVFGLLATVFVTALSFAQDGKITSSSFSQNKSSVEIPEEIKSKSVWTEETANQFVTLSVYRKEYDSFISLTLNVEDHKIVSLNVPQEAVNSQGISERIRRNHPCWTVRCVLEDWFDWLNNL